MDMRAAKLALARKKLKDHQEKKIGITQKSDILDTIDAELLQDNKTPSELHYIGDVTSADHSENLGDGFNTTKKPDQIGVNINVAEILISNKRNLEEQVANLQLKLNQLELDYELEVKCHNSAKQQVSFLQIELKDLMDKYETVMQNKLLLDKKIEELNKLKMSLVDDNNNLTEQLEYTKSILSTKEAENTQMNNQLHLLKNELDFTQIQLQQLTSGSNVCVMQSNTNTENIEKMVEKINSLEELLKTTQKEKNQINIHYEQYVRELNQHLKSAISKNEELSKEMNNFSIRENSLIDQICEMETKLQNIEVKKEEIIDNASITCTNHEELIDLQNKYAKTQEELQEIIRKYTELKDLYTKSQYTIQKLQEEINSSNNHDNISISKLTADIASDKIAAQRATEQNKKLKTSIQELEESFVKMSRDKLELTEKLTAEKYLNRELTIKLAEFEEKSKDLHIKLRAKDEEMIRLQMSCRELEEELEKRITEENITKKELDRKETVKATQSSIEGNVKRKNMSDNANNNESLHDCIKTSEKDNIPKEDAMLKLQERFMKIMGEVADLSDEKHRLEHIILQLQNETDTICEYVALYQQQRSLLKKRDEERNAQIKLFQTECDRLKSQLEELSRIILKFADDRELSTYFQIEHRKHDMEKIRTLLINLRNSTFIDPKSSLELSSVYPCNCCSGNLIDV